MGGGLGCGGFGVLFAVTVPSSPEGIGAEAMDSSACAHIVSLLLSEGHHVVAAFLVG